GARDELVDGWVLVERHVAADALVRADEQRVEKVLGVRVVGVPIFDEEVGVAVARRFAGRGIVALDERDPDADGGQIRLDGLRDSLKRLVLPNPQLDGESLRVARGGEQGAGFCGVVSIGWSR